MKIGDDYHTLFIIFKHHRAVSLVSVCDLKKGFRILIRDLHLALEGNRISELAMMIVRVWLHNEVAKKKPLNFTNFTTTNKTSLRIFLNFFLYRKTFKEKIQNLTC